MKVLLLLAVMAVTVPAHADSEARAATYPSHPIRIIVAGPPGVPPDIAARLVTERLAASLGQPVLVENRPGASGTIGVAEVVKARADGYTIGVFGMPYTVSPALYPNLPYDTLRDLAPVYQLAWSSQLLVVSAASPWRNVADLVMEAKRHPGKLTFSSGQPGVTSDLVGEMLKLRAGIDIRGIPFRGALEGLGAVMGGQTDFMFAPVGAAAGAVKGGKVRLLATATPTRLPAYAEVPTMAEVGYPGFDVRDWNGIVAPAATPREIISRLASEIRAALDDPAVRARFVAISMDPALDSGPEQFGALIRAELARWATFVRESGIRAN
jgi:tripartite-type tricarboxylate transporter receptor subunit TctC